MMTAFGGNGVLRWLVVALSVLTLSACHAHGHAPFGLAKQAVDPNPGHGGNPPGRN